MPNNPSQPVGVPQLDNGLSRLLNRILDTIRQQRFAFMSLRVIARGHQLESAFFNALVEDRTPAGLSYVEFLCAVHKQIQSKFQE